MTDTVLKLDRFAYGGAAMGRAPDPDGRAVFVPFGLPGELVRVRLVAEKRGFARAELLEVLEASPQRVSPKCLHFGECGGCHYQHLPYEAQLSAKTEILRDQLERIGKIENPPIQPMVACPHPWNYRNHVQFHLTDDGKLGYIRAGFGELPGPSPRSAIVPIKECHLPEERLNTLWPQLTFEAGAPSSPRPLVERVSLRAGADALLLVLEAQELEPPEMELEARISVVHLAGQDALVMAGEDHLTMQVQERAFHVSAGSFFQVNTVMAERMVGHLVGVLPLPARTILDVYCGVGLFSAFLAPQCERLIGVEASESACEDFAFNLDEFDNVELYEGTASDVIPGLAGRISSSPPEQTILLVDPPRAGLDRHALEGVLVLQPGTIVYVSCDPATLARDAARLIGKGYRLARVTPFDLFPQTYHIESISLFTLKE
jgi:23S rRNA (uracil1939-C5)-methyltransferase